MTGVGVLLVLLTTLGALAAVVSFVLPGRVGQAVTVMSGVASLGMAITLAGPTAHAPVRLGFLRADAVSCVFVIAVAFVYACAAVYSIGYRHRHDHHGRYLRRFYLGLNAFAWSMLCAPLVDGLALLWVAIEITTVVSALLVATDRTRSSAEAAWKYVLIASAGLGLGLLATIVLYYAGSRVYGPSYELTLSQLVTAGHRLPVTPARFAFLLAILGYGTKVGLVPVHTWLPDAHSEAPTPISAMLSGSLLVVSFYAVLRFVQITTPALGARFDQNVLIVFGVASLLVAALSLLRQRDVKRLLAYSSVEHMGILCLGVGFGAPIALAGVLLHVLAHAAAKGNAFFAAGVLLRKFGTKDIRHIRGGLDLLPWTGPLLLCAVLALSALPPFGIFRSEFQIVAGGLGDGRTAIAAVLVVLVTLAFLGITVAFTRMLFVPARHRPETAPLERGEPSPWMVAPMVIGLIALVVLGLHPPDALTHLLSQGVTELGGTP
ncbi:MAG TPA: proton-conducting transporter membrane subunit [Pseudonocardiaceae bacterium]|nr:proton-conducting transporter membrane subunit [Pseudonocardiaceae bacterium]